MNTKNELITVMENELKTMLDFIERKQKETAAKSKEDEREQTEGRLVAYKTMQLFIQGRLDSLKNKEYSTGVRYSRNEFEEQGGSKESAIENLAKQFEYLRKRRDQLIQERDSEYMLDEDKDKIVVNCSTIAVYPMSIKNRREVWESLIEAVNNQISDTRIAIQNEMIAPTTILFAD